MANEEQGLHDQSSVCAAQRSRRGSLNVRGNEEGHHHDDHRHDGPIRWKKTMPGRKAWPALRQACAALDDGATRSPSNARVLR
jgi:hypothetical protein